MTATDARYGRRGGNWLPPEKPKPEPVLGPGLARVVCGCDVTWIVAVVDVGRTCHSCGQTMRKMVNG